MYGKIILIGVLISVLYSELTGLSAGLILPGYFVLCLKTPGRIVYTILIALIAAGLTKLVSRRLILYGKRRFAVILIFTFFLDFAAEKLGILPGSFSLIGILVPGILGREIDRQGIVYTLLSLVVTTGLLTVLLMLLNYPVFGR